MKTAFLTFLFIFCLVASTHAATEDRLPVVCDATKNVLDQIKKKKYELVLMGEVDSMQTMIFVNPDQDMVIAVIVSVNKESTTCIFVGGEKNTIMFRTPHVFNDNEKDL